jgi:putative membrane protein
VSLEPKIESKNEAQREALVRQAQLFTPPNAAAEIIRPASEFVPIDKIPRPSAVTAEPEVVTAGQIRLEALPIKGLKTALIAGGVLGTLAIGWPLMQWLTWAFALQPLLGVGVLMTFTLLLSFCGAGVVQVIKSQAQVNELVQLQEQAQQLTGHKTFGKAHAYTTALQAFYREKPQGEMLAEVLNNLPDYADDHEILAHIEGGFLAPLDQEALRRINSYSTQTALAVALSPWVSLDMALSLLRNGQMLSRIGELYGLRPSMLGRWRLIKMVVAHLVSAGASEWAMDQAIDTLGLGAAQMAGLRATQGIGAGLYTAKIGLAAMDVCRPMGFSAEQKPVFKHLWEHLVVQVRGRFKI